MRIFRSKRLLYNCLEILVVGLSGSFTCCCHSPPKHSLSPTLSLRPELDWLLKPDGVSSSIAIKAVLDGYNGAVLPAATYCSIKDGLFFQEKPQRAVLRRRTSNLESQSQGQGFSSPARALRSLAMQPHNLKSRLTYAEDVGDAGLQSWPPCKELHYGPSLVSLPASSFTRRRSFQSFCVRCSSQRDGS